MIAWVGEKGERIKEKKPHRHRKQYGDYQKEREVGGGRRGYRGINGDRRVVNTQYNTHVL